MAHEITVPLLPCGSIDEIVEFYTMLGFTRTYYQVRPNPCAGLQREDLQLQFFGMPGFKPEDSYGSCVVIVPDTQQLFEAFAAGMRAVHGKLLVSGIPRMTRPRKRKNADHQSGFTVIDPGGNWIRIFPSPGTSGNGAPAVGKLAKALENAVVLGDSKGDTRQAAKILDATLAREQDGAPAADLVEALAYRAELAIRVDDTTSAVDALTRARAVPLTKAERSELAAHLAGLEDLEAVVGLAP
ncbi:VOC family protein [Streptomyces sp. NPDC057621]|uniref:VOC family protein n=1 Tax=Streptomyces liliiviolaceus TaxID=2823109 RepID=A0A940Y2J9_9ACTN|nr:VOC family protein [Streptomyces liliiviolaceus]MBQ0852052.1 VOC family protein [Streptomyces liliiviolaceus]